MPRRHIGAHMLDADRVATLTQRVREYGCELLVKRAGDHVTYVLVNADMGEGEGTVVRSADLDDVEAELDDMDATDAAIAAAGGPAAGEAGQGS